MLSFLQHPLARGLDIDAPSTTYARKRIIREKQFLRRIYQEWYGSIVQNLPAGDGRILEIGTGAGFLSDYVPDLITSDIFLVPGHNLVLDSQRLPFATGSLRAIVMTEVLHHIPNPRLFFNEATRCVRPGGAMVLIEPWNTWWSRLIFTRLHHEPFRAQATEWSFPSTGPLSGANGANPWIVFERDRSQFLHEYPQWRIRSVRLTMPFRYLVSGGVSFRSFMPGWTLPLWRGAEGLLQPFASHLAMFACIVLDRLP